MRRPIKFRGKLNRRGRKLIKQVRKKVEAAKNAPADKPAEDSGKEAK